MKKLLLAIAMVASFSTFAADELITTWSCSRFPQVPDLGFGVTVKEGGLAGITQVTVSQFFLGHSKSETVFAKHVPGIDSVEIIDRETNGNVLYLSINPMFKRPNGDIAGTVKFQGQTTQLSCKAVNKEE